MIAFLTLEAATPPALEALARGLEPRLGEAFSVRVDSREGLLCVRVGDEEVRVIPRSERLPDELVRGPAEDAWYWPEAAAVLARHRCYLLVALKESASPPVQRSLLLSRVAAAVGATAGYSAVYWDAATMVHPASAFDAAVAAMAPGDLPVKLWVHFRTVDEPDGSRSLSTVGLEALGHREIEVWGAQAAVEEILGWSYNVAHYLLSESPTIEDGQAIATDRTRWVHVFLRPSMLDPERTIYCLVLDPDSAPREDPQAR